VDDAPAGEPRRRRILVVDDEPAIGRAVARFLQGAAVEVDAFTTASHALAEFERSADAYAAALVDWQMPTEPGHRVVAHLRAIRADLPIFIVTGHALDAQALESEGLPGCRVMRKPFDPQTLLASLSETLGDVS